MLDIAFVVFGFLVLSIGFVVFFGAPYVPTLKKQLNDIVTIHPLTKKDVFVDIGSGDGVVLRAVSNKVKRAVGYELGPWLWVVSWLLCRRYSNIHIFFGSFWSKELPEDMTVAYTFLNGAYMPKLERKLQLHVDTYGRKVRFITYGFKIAGRRPTKKQGPMYMYIFTPTLQT